jgi:hypothetical protein
VDCPSPSPPPFAGGCERAARSWPPAFSARAKLADDEYVT